MVWRKRIYILEQGTQEKGVAISYDSRKMSKEFSLQTALILNANGIKTYLFENLRPDRKSVV